MIKTNKKTNYVSQKSHRVVRALPSDNLIYN